MENNQQDKFNEVQFRGLDNYTLTNEQVQAKNFGEYTLFAMDTLKKRDSTKSYQEVFSMIEELNVIQNIGLSRYNLTKEQVQSKNFGKYTLNAIDALKKEFLNKDIQDVFEKVKNLDDTQVKGVLEFKLTREQVETPNYGMHTIVAIRDIMKQALAPNYEDAFAMISELNKFQTGWVLRLNLTKDEILQTPNFGEHTIEAMNSIMRQGNSNNYKKAFEMVKGLNKHKVKEVSRCQLTREQVENPNFRTGSISNISVSKLKLFTHTQNSQWLKKEQQRDISMTSRLAKKSEKKTQSQ